MAVGTADYAIKNLNEKTNAEIEGFLKKSKEELFNLRFQAATGQLDNTARLKAVKHDIARMYTIMRLTSGRKKDFILHFPRIVERLENTTPPALRHG